MKKYKLIYQPALSFIMITSLMLSGCSKDVQCAVKERHIHLYVDESDKLIKYIPGEKDYVGAFKRTDKYIPATDINDLIADNNLFIIADNYVYLNLLYNSYQPHREEYVEQNINGPYLTITDDLHFKIITGFHTIHTWVTLDNDSTPNPVRDVTYSLKVFTIKDNKLESKVFNSLQDIPSNYKYFKIQNVIIKNTGDEYYLGSKRVLTK